MRLILLVFLCFPFGIDAVEQVYATKLGELIQYLQKDDNELLEWQIVLGRLDNLSVDLFGKGHDEILDKRISYVFKAIHADDFVLTDETSQQRAQIVGSCKRLIDKMKVRDPSNAEVIDKNWFAIDLFFFFDVIPLDR